MTRLPLWNRWLSLNASVAAPARTKLRGGWYPGEKPTSLAIADIAVEQPESNDLTSGVSTVNFGQVTEFDPSPLEFVIRSPGTINLTGISASIVDNVTGDYFVTSPRSGESAEIRLQDESRGPGLPSLLREQESSRRSHSSKQSSSPGFEVGVTLGDSWPVEFSQLFKNQRSGA